MSKHQPVISPTPVVLHVLVQMKPDGDFKNFDKIELSSHTSMKSSDIYDLYLSSSLFEMCHLGGEKTTVIIEPLWMAYHSVDLTNELMPCCKVHLFLFLKDVILIFEHTKKKDFCILF